MLLIDIFEEEVELKENKADECDKAAQGLGNNKEREHQVKEQRVGNKANRAANPKAKEMFREKHEHRNFFKAVTKKHYKERIMILLDRAGIFFGPEMKCTGGLV